MKVYIKNIENLTLPKQASQRAAGYDIVATSDPKISGIKGRLNNTWESIDYIEYETNLFLAPSIQTVHYFITPRSSISKYNLMLANSIGTIDNDYRGMLLCRFNYIWQPGDFMIDPDHPGYILGTINESKIYQRGDKIAQIVFEPTINNIEFELVDELPQTERGEGGFGSTGK